MLKTMKTKLSKMKILRKRMIVIAVQMSKIIPAGVVEKQVRGGLRSKAKAESTEEAPLAVADTVVEGIPEEGRGKRRKFPNTRYKSFWHHNELASDD